MKLTLLLILATTGSGCHREDDSWTPAKKAEYEYQMQEFAKRKERDQAEVMKREAERVHREQERLQKMSADEMISEIMKKADDCVDRPDIVAISQCNSAAAETIASLILVLRKRPHSQRYVAKALSKYRKVRTLADEQGETVGQVAMFKEHVKTCCNAPKFTYSKSAKAQCINWGLAKCVVD